MKKTSKKVAKRPQGSVVKGKDNQKGKTTDTKTETVSIQEKKKRFWERKLLYIVLFLSFLLPILIFYIVLLQQDFFPNGSKTLLFMDLKGEYTEYLASLRAGLNPDNSLFFSWSHSMGGDMLGLYAFYSGGFLSFFSSLFPVQEIYKGILLTELIGVGLSGLSFAIFLEWGFHEKKADLSVVAFSICYALMSYNMVYANCYFWLNGSIFLPLIFLGIERLFQGKKGILFYITLVLAMVNNYYTAYMICIFSVFYFLFRAISLIGSKQRKFKVKEIFIIFARYAGTACLAAMTSFPLLYSVYKGLQAGKLAVSTDWFEGETWFEFMKVFPKFLSGKYDSITSENMLPSLFCGTATLILLAFWFILWERTALSNESEGASGQTNKKGGKIAFLIPEKLSGCVVILIMLLSMWRVKLDEIWHGFQQPHWFHWRYAFLLGFFLVFLASRAFGRMHFIRGKGRVIFSFLLLIFCSFDMAHNASVCIKGLGDQFGYMDVSEYDAFMSKTTPLVEKVKETDDGLFRMDKDYEFSKNDSLLLGYNGMTHYSSTYNLKVNQVTPQLGLAQAWYWNSGLGASSLVDSIFGVRYRMATRPMPSTYEGMETSGDATLYRNTQALPLVFSANAGCTALQELTGDVFQNQNALLSALCGTYKDYFTPETFEQTDTAEGHDLTFQAKDDQPVYMFLQWTGGYGGEVYVNDQYLSQYFTNDTTSVLYLGTFQPGETVKVSIKSGDATYGSVWIESLDTIQMTGDLDVLRAGGMEITSHKHGKLSGKIHVEEGQLISTSIPDVEGYKVLVDGKKVKTQNYLGTFMAFEAEPGDHEISISYRTPGFLAGLPVAILGILGMVIYVLGWKKIIVLFKKNKL